MHDLKVSTLASFTKSYYRHQHSINILEYDYIKAVASWRQAFSDKINGLIASNYISRQTAIDAIHKVFHPFRLFLLEGKASIYTYLWPNDEYKSLVLWGNNHFYASIEDLFWLPKYPFLSESFSSKNATFNFSNPIANQYPVTGIVPCELLLSHNLHFGHFIVDDLPSLHFVTQSKPLLASVSGLLQKVHPPIIDASSYILSSASRTLAPILMPSIPSQPTPVLTCHNSNHLFQVKTANLYHQCFLSRHLIRSTRTLRSYSHHCSNIPKRIFLIRQGSYLSRISNLVEVRRLLQAYGFTLVNPATYKFSYLHYCLRQAEIIVSEGGSTGINAAVLSSVCTKVLLLLSQSMLTETSESMQISGLPYSLAFLDHVDILGGASVTNGSIQSSDIVEYDLDRLDAWLMQHC